MELALAANDDIYIVIFHECRPTEDTRISKKIGNLNLSSWLSWLAILLNSMMLKSRRKLKLRSKLHRRRRTNSASLTKNPAIHLNQKLKKNLRSQLKLIYLMLHTSQILHQLPPKKSLLTCWAWLTTLLQSKNPPPMYLTCLDLQKTILNPSLPTYLFPPIKRWQTTIWECLNLSPIPTNSHLKVRFLKETTSQQESVNLSRAMPWETSTYKAISPLKTYLIYNIGSSKIRQPFNFGQIDWSSLRFKRKQKRMIRITNLIINHIFIWIK